MPQVERQCAAKARLPSFQAVNRQPRQRRIRGEDRWPCERDAQVGRHTARVGQDVATLGTLDRAVGVEDALSGPDLSKLDGPSSHGSAHRRCEGGEPLRCDVAVGRGELVKEVDRAGHAWDSERAGVDRIRATSVCLMLHCSNT